MSIYCEINLFKRPDNVYKPGDTVHGVVKYELTEETVFSKITTSLKGLGKLHVTQHLGSTTRFFTDEEKFVDIDDIVLDNTKGIPTPAGPHEVPFSFILPQNIPPNFKYKKFTEGYNVHCKIFYYVRIKFEKYGLLNLNKKFKKKIKVASIVSPKLPTSSVSHAFEKKPFQPFWQKGKVNIKGTVENSVTSPKGQVKIGYEVNNGTNLDIKGVKIRLSQEIHFKCLSTFPDLTNEVKLNEFSATPLKAGDTQVMELIMDIPPDVVTMQHSRLVSRNYFVNVVAELPLPHRNAVMKMPIEVVDNDRTEDVENLDDDSPPSYFEAMDEYKKDELE